MADATPRVEWRSAEVRVPRAVLAAQAAGDPGEPTLLLLGGATWSRDWWPDALCATLVAAGHHVIRYDPRDTGASTLSPVGAPDYDADDLAADAVAVLDAHTVERAVLIGLSMGAGLAQSLAATERDRVAGLVLLCCSPAFPTDTELPGPSAELVAGWDDPPPDPDWGDRSAVVDWVATAELSYAGPTARDESGLRELIGRVWDRTPSLAPAASNHPMVAAGGASITRDAVRGLPTLVVHGTDDPLFPLPHGRALAAELGAPLVELAGVGHQVPPAATWPELVERITALTRSTRLRE